MKPMTFEEWLETEDGKRSMDLSAPVVQPYLRNRLWWAFEAGVKSGLNDFRLQKTLEWYENERSELKSRNSALAKELNALKKSHDPKEAHL